MNSIKGSSNKHIGDKPCDLFCLHGKCFNEKCFSVQYCLESFLAANNNKRHKTEKKIKPIKEHNPLLCKIVKSNCKKISYPTINDAAKAFLQLLIKGKHNAEMYYYECKSCEAYHITRKRGKGRFSDEIIKNIIGD